MLVAESVSASLIYDGGGSLVRVRRSERATASDPWITTEQECTVAYELVSIGHRLGGRELFVAGLRTDNCSPILEKWRFPEIEGAYSVTAEPVAVGEPSGPFQGVVVSPPTYVPPAQRGALRAPIRTTLSSSSPAWLELGMIRSVVADPEGRFVLLHSYSNGNLYRLKSGVADPALMLANPGAPHPLASARKMALYDHEDSGRVLVIKNSWQGLMDPQSVVVVLEDAANDGEFETPRVMTQANYVNSYSEGLVNLAVIE